MMMFSLCCGFCLPALKPGLVGPDSTLLSNKSSEASLDTAPALWPPYSPWVVLCCCSVGSRKGLEGCCLSVSAGAIDLIWVVEKAA